MQIPLPLSGLNDNLAFSAQPPTTSRDLVNVGTDRQTNRLRFASRPGMSRYCPDNAGHKIQFMGQTTTDSRKMAYSANAGETESFAVLPSFQMARVLAKDGQGNKYASDGSTITKFNRDWAVVWVLTPPMKDSAGIIRALWVDEAGNLFIGVSEGGVQDKARVWRFQEQKSGPPKQVWQYPPDPETPILPGFFVEKVILRADKLYVLANYPDRWGAFLIVFAGALTTGPTEAWRKEVAYPARDFVLKADGSIVGCSAPFEFRGLDPRYRNFTQKTLDWQITDLVDYDRRVWIDLNAAVIADQVNAGKSATDPTRLKEADAIATWLDQSRYARDIFTSGQTTFGAAPQPFHTDPLYSVHGIGAKPAIHFRGQQVGPPQFADVYQTQYSYSVTASASDQHRGLVPGYETAKWCMFIVFRPEEDKQDPATHEIRRGVWSQSTATGSTAAALSLNVNRNSAGNEAAGIGSFADIVNAAGVGVGGTAGATQPMHFNYGEAPSAGIPNGNNVGGAGVLTILWDGGDTSTAEPGTHSLIRWNGKPLDRWKSLTAAFAGTTDPSDIGTSVNAYLASFGSYRGYIARIIVLRDMPTAPEGLLSHPHYPWNIHAAATQPTVNAWAAGSDTEMERIEGMLAHEYGLAHLLDSGAYMAPNFGGAPVAPWTPVDPGNWPHPYTLANGPPRKSATASRSEAFQMHNPEGLVWKLDGAKGDIKWVCAPASGGVLGGGMGTSVAVDEDGNIGSIGNAIESDVTGQTFNYESSPYNVRKIIDLNGTGPSGFEAGNTVGSGSWAKYLSVAAVGPPPFINPFVEHARIAFDDHGNLYVPIDSSDTDPGDQFTLKVFASWPSATTASVPPNIAWPSAIQEPELLAAYLSAAGDVGQCVVVDKSPVYRFGATYDWDRAPTAIARTARAEFAYLGVSQPTPAQTQSTYKVRLVTATAVTGPPRTHTLIVVAGGFVFKASPAGMTQFAGAGTIDQTVTGALDATAEYVDGFEIGNPDGNGSVFVLFDGKKYVYVDPINDAVLLWKATDGGAIPLRRKIGCNWRGRAFLGRGVDEPSHWDMSELGNFRHWNLKTVPANSPTRAFKGEASRIGLCPDVINAAYSYSDNQLIVFGDHSMWALTGDPADEGTSAGWRMVSDSTGGAFGRPACKDPEGNLFVFGSRGGVYAIPPNLSLVSLAPAPKSMTEDTIEQRLADIDLATYRVELTWNTDDDALHVWLIPFTTGAAPTHYRWLSRTKAWYEVTTGFDVSAVLNIDGDAPDDRRMLVAGADGYIRMWDVASKTDDGAEIETRALIGPLVPEVADTEFRFSDLEVVMAIDQDPVEVNVYGSNTPEEKGDVRWTGEFRPGRNIIPMRVTAAYVWIEFKQVHANRRWACESMKFRQAVPAGRKRIGA